MRTVQLTVGFDLDLTLIDPRAAVIATAERLAVEEGVVVDAELWASRLGPPLEHELACWVAEDRVVPAARRYRELMASATGLIALLPERPRRWPSYAVPAAGSSS